MSTYFAPIADEIKDKNKIIAWIFAESRMSREVKVRLGIGERERRIGKPTDCNRELLDERNNYSKIYISRASIFTKMISQNGIIRYANNSTKFMYMNGKQNMLTSIKCKKHLNKETVGKQILLPVYN